MRFGFVIVDSSKRGKGYGKGMLELAIRYAFDILKAERITLGVFENNAPAYRCYKAVGFRDLELPELLVPESLASGLLASELLELSVPELLGASPSGNSGGVSPSGISGGVEPSGMDGGVPPSARR